MIRLLWLRRQIRDRALMVRGQWCRRYGNGWSNGGRCHKDQWRRCALGLHRKRAMEEFVIPGKLLIVHSVLHGKLLTTRRSFTPWSTDAFTSSPCVLVADAILSVWIVLAGLCVTSNLSDFQLKSCVLPSSGTWSVQECVGVFNSRINNRPPSRRKKYNQIPRPLTPPSPHNSSVNLPFFSIISVSVREFLPKSGAPRSCQVRVPLDPFSTVTACQGSFDHTTSITFISFEKRRRS